MDQKISLQAKKSCIWATEFCDFKMDAMKCYLNFVSCNFGTYDFYEAFS